MSHNILIFNISAIYFHSNESMQNQYNNQNNYIFIKLYFKENAIVFYKNIDALSKKSYHKMIKLLNKISFMTFFQVHLNYR